MRAALFRRDSTGQAIEPGTRPTPEPGPGEIAIRVEACGICGTDLHSFHAGTMPPGHTPGHEMVGRVVSHGSDMPAARTPGPGTRVVVEPLVSCGTCVYCRAGRDSICPESRLFGLHLPGGMAEMICVPAHRAFPVAEDLAAPVAALTEPVAVAVHGLERGALAAGQRVLVLGSGSVGLATLVAARALGAAEVWTSARYEQQAELARDLGATRVLREEEATPEALGTLAREVDFDLVVETVGGSADTVTAAVSAARPGGRVSVIGVFLGPVSVASMPALMKELDLSWSNCYQRASDRAADFAVAIELVERERERLALLTTHQLPLSDIGKAFEIAGNKSSGAVKVTVLLDE